MNIFSSGTIIPIGNKMKKSNLGLVDDLFSKYHECKNDHNSLYLIYTSILIMAMFINSVLKGIRKLN
jgi:hypothetical protein